ncbi:hypothetical protein ECG_05541 [Echinococcus granulosus]|nr:hypothetical protein ECG_05541 [Echinococcus granulosus]
MEDLVNAKRRSRCVLFCDHTEVDHVTGVQEEARCIDAPLETVGGAQCKARRKQLTSQSPRGTKSSSDPPVAQPVLARLSGLHEIKFVSIRLPLLASRLTYQMRKAGSLDFLNTAAAMRSSMNIHGVTLHGSGACLKVTCFREYDNAA